MTYQGVVKNGTIVLEEGVQLPEGALVEITPRSGPGNSAGLPGFGLWRDRTDLGDSADAARDLRREAEQSGGR